MNTAGQIEGGVSGGAVIDADALSTAAETVLEASTKPARKRRRTRHAHPGVKILARERAGGVVWLARWRDPDSSQWRETSLDALGRRTREARRNWAIAKSQALTERRAALAAGAVRHSDRELGAAVKDYIDHSEKTKRASTVDAMRPALTRFLEWAEKRGIKKTDDVQPHDLAAFREWLTATTRTSPQAAAKRGARRPSIRPLSRTSVNSYLKAVKSCLNWLRRTGLLAHVASIEQVTEAMRSVRVPKEDHEILTAEQVRHLLRSCLAHDEATWTLTREEHDGEAVAGTTKRYTPMAPFVAFVLLTGCRVGEALSLEWRDVDLDALDDEGRKVGAVKVTAAKSKTDAARSIGLEVSPGLRALLATMKLRAGGKGRVFSDLTEPSVKRALERLVRPEPGPSARQRAAGFGAPPFGWHTLRRTCGTFLACAPSIYGAGAVLLAAQQLGHSVEVAQRHYLGRVRGIPRGLTTLDAVFGIEDLLARVRGDDREESAPTVVSA